MTPATSPGKRRWRDLLPPYGDTRSTAASDPAEGPAPAVRSEPRRRSGALGWLLALLTGAALAMLALQTMEDPRSVGTQLDDAVANVRAVGSQAQRSLTDSQHAVADASHQAVDGVGTAISDAGISLKVKTALAADPALSASRINVDTVGGVVRLEGPAPDTKARERASVLAAAPRGVRGVDNRLTLPQGSQVVPVQSAALPASAAAPVSLDGPAAEDTAVSSRVDAALTADAAFARTKLVVSTRQGVVRLEGVVPDAPARDRAVTLAASQAGVKSVDNRLMTSEAAQLLARGPQ
ncbi:BON domain-containing protein [Roseateles asaccharophilus]|uniref:Osmotically-inducible protein OsmY n=1 Tax=Roseateles asaccharophilus TaxID=582607 RepID=A0ABU2A3D4_9BURK|nr:BON domain-containing protein [Roseateles asaccharophilus]MDR7331706.1 osmotically-inducible protein OsmY [Roseateles asaccharophilus]